MSDVKICNRHGGMFGAKERGSALLTGTIYRDPVRDGLDEEDVKWDICANCVVEMQRTSRMDYPAISRIENDLGMGE